MHQIFKILCRPLHVATKQATYPYIWFFVYQVVYHLWHQTADISHHFVAALVPLTVAKKFFSRADYLLYLSVRVCVCD